MKTRSAIFMILSAAELGFTAAKAATLMLNLERRVWKVCAFVFFIVESILGIITTIWLAIIFYNPHNLGFFLVVLTEFFSIACEFMIIRRRVHNIEAPEPTIWANRFRQFVKHFAFVGCALVSIVFGFLGYWDRSSLGVFMTSLVLVCSLTVFGLSVFATRRTRTRTLSAIFVVLFFSLFALIRPYVRINELHSFVVHDFLRLAGKVLVFQAAAGTFLVALAAWRVPGIRTDSGPDAATVDVLETAVFGVTVPLVVLSAVGVETSKLIILTVLPQSMVIIGPICFAYFSDLVRKP